MGRYYAPPPPPPAGIDDVERIMWTVLVIFLVVLPHSEKGPLGAKVVDTPQVFQLPALHLDSRANDQRAPASGSFEYAGRAGDRKGRPRARGANLQGGRGHLPPGRAGRRLLFPRHRGVLRDGRVVLSGCRHAREASQARPGHRRGGDAEPEHHARVHFDERTASNKHVHGYTPPSLHKLKPVEKIQPKVSTVGTYKAAGLMGNLSADGCRDYFGEKSLERTEPRPATVTCKTDVTVLRLPAAKFLKFKRDQDHKENLMRKVPFFDTFSDDQIAIVAQLLTHIEFRDKEAILVEGEEAHQLYIMESGECVATKKDANGIDQEQKRYHFGDVFGEDALLGIYERRATITAVGEMAVWMLNRDAFESKLGKLAELKAEQYLADPRALIGNFYAKGDKRGRRVRSRQKGRRRMEVEARARRRGLWYTGRARVIRSRRCSAGWVPARASTSRARAPRRIASPALSHSARSRRTRIGSSWRRAPRTADSASSTRRRPTARRRGGRWRARWLR